jgi:hypothetical protein
MSLFRRKLPLGVIWDTEPVIPREPHWGATRNKGPVCRDELLYFGHLGCSKELEGRCLSVLPCKYKGLCADAPITEQEV